MGPFCLQTAFHNFPKCPDAVPSRKKSHSEFNLLKSKSDRHSSSLGLATADRIYSSTTSYELDIPIILFSDIGSGGSYTALSSNGGAVNLSSPTSVGNRYLYLRQLFLQRRRCLRREWSGNIHTPPLLFHVRLCCQLMIFIKY